MTMAIAMTAAPTTGPSARTAVVQLQLLLLTRGFPPGPIDGLMGPQTECAIQKAATLAGITLAMPSAVVPWLRARPALPVLVPRVSTPVSLAELLPALREAHQRAIGAPLDDARLRMAHAQLAAEHGFLSASNRGLKFVHTYNLGNVMTGKGYAGPWFQMVAKERDKYGNEVPRKSQWRAGAEPAEGAWLYWDMLQRRFSNALALMSDGHPATFAHALKVAGYFTALETDYQHLLTACWEMLAA